MQCNLHCVNVVTDVIVTLKSPPSIDWDRQCRHDQCSQPKIDIIGGGLNYHDVDFPQACRSDCRQCQLCKLTIGQHRYPKSAEQSLINE